MSLSEITFNSLQLFFHFFDTFEILYRCIVSLKFKYVRVEQAESIKKGTYTNSVVPDETLQNVESHQGLSC